MSGKKRRPQRAKRDWDSLRQHKDGIKLRAHTYEDADEMTLAEALEYERRANDG